MDRKTSPRIRGPNPLHRSRRPRISGSGAIGIGCRPEQARQPSAREHVPVELLNGTASRHLLTPSAASHPIRQIATAKALGAVGAQKNAEASHLRSTSACCGLFIDNPYSVHPSRYSGRIRASSSGALVATNFSASHSTFPSAHRAKFPSKTVSLNGPA